MVGAGAEGDEAVVPDPLSGSGAFFFGFVTRRLFFGGNSADAAETVAGALEPATGLVLLEIDSVVTSLMGVGFASGEGEVVSSIGAASS